MTKLTEKYISKIKTDFLELELNDLLNYFSYRMESMIAAIYVVVKLSLLSPAIGQKVISALEPLIEVWRDEPYEWDEDEDRDDWQEWLIEDRKKWICFCDRIITKKALATPKIKYTGKVKTGVQGLTKLLENSEDETIAAIYALVNLSLLKPEAGQKIITALKPLIKLWRGGHYGHRLARGEPEEIQRWICFYDRFIRRRAYRRSYVGRKTKYTQRYTKKAGHLAEVGCTDKEIAQKLDISTSTLWEWKKKHKEFAIAIERGRKGFVEDE